MKNFLLPTILLIAFFTAFGSMAQTLKAKFYFTVDCYKVSFFDTSTANIYNHNAQWDYGDGSAPQMAYNPDHLFPNNGTSTNYNVRLTVGRYDSSLNKEIKDTTYRSVTVYCPGCAFSMNFSKKVDSADYKKLLFKDERIGGYNMSYSWYFDHSGSATSTAQNPVHTFPAKGNYYVMFKGFYYDTAYNKHCRDSITKLIHVNQLKAGFTYTIDTGDCSTVHFTSTSTGSPAFYSWSFGDWAGGANTQNPTHEYLANDTFNIILMVFDSISNNNVFADTTYGQVIINCNKCYIRAVLSIYADSLVPYSAILYNNSTGTINKHHWDFGDGGTSTQRDPVHSYTVPGNITLTYVAMDTTTGCADTAILKFKIDSAGYLKRKVFTLKIIDNTSTKVEQVLSDNDDIRAYPNPFNNSIYLSFAKLNASTKVQVYNSLGQKVQSELTLNAGKGVISFNGELTTGIYLIHITDGDKQWHFKLLKE